MQHRKEYSSERAREREQVSADRQGTRRDTNSGKLLVWRQPSKTDSGQTLGSPVPATAAVCRPGERDAAVTDGADSFKRRPDCGAPPFFHATRESSLFPGQCGGNRQHGCQAQRSHKDPMLSPGVSALSRRLQTCAACGALSLKNFSARNAQCVETMAAAAAHYAKAAEPCPPFFRARQNLLRLLPERRHPCTGVLCADMHSYNSFPSG